MLLIRQNTQTESVKISLKKQKMFGFYRNCLKSDFLTSLGGFDFLTSLGGFV